MGTLFARFKYGLYDFYSPVKMIYFLFGFSRLISMFAVSSYN